MPRIPLDDLDDPRLTVYRQLPRTNLTRHGALFVAEGDKVVERLLQSRFPVVSLLLEEQFADGFCARNPVSNSLDVFTLPQARLEQLVGFQFHRGALGCGRRLPSPPLVDWLSPSTDRIVLVACPQMHSPDNLASVLRTAHALGIAGVLIGRGSADPFSRRVLRVSMASALLQPLCESSNPLAEIVELREKFDFEIVAAVLDPAAETIDRFRPARRSCLVLGNEAHGLSEPWLRECNRRVTIPMNPAADSLNVSVAAGILLHQIARG